MPCWDGCGGLRVVSLLPAQHPHTSPPDFSKQNSNDMTPLLGFRIKPKHLTTGYKALWNFPLERKWKFK